MHDANSRYADRHYAKEGNLLDPAIYNSNTREFRGTRLSVPETDQRVDEGDALEAIREFVDVYGTRPTAEAWTAAGMTPSEKTIRRRFGSFAVAIRALGSTRDA